MIAVPAFAGLLIGTAALLFTTFVLVRVAATAERTDEVVTATAGVIVASLAVSAFGVALAHAAGWLP